MKHQDRPEDTDFDLRARAELALAFEPGEPPTHLLRHTPWYARRGLHALCAAVIVASVAAGSALSPPGFHATRLTGSPRAKASMLSMS